jgi:hypothetical protein
LDTTLGVYLQRKSKKTRKYQPCGRFHLSRQKEAALIISHSLEGG